MDKKLHIGIVANTAFNIYNFRLGLIKALQQEGHHVVAIAPTDTYAELLKENQIEFIEVQNLARKGTNPLNDFRLMNEFRRIYRQQKLDVVLQYTIKPNIYGTLAARLTNTKSICTVTGLGYTFLNDSMASRVAHRLYRLAFSFADKVLFQNTDDLEIFVNNKLVNRQKTQIVPGSGIDIVRFSSEFCTPKEGDGIIRFLMIGRLLKDKGVYEYAEAARQIVKENPNAEFHLLGDIDNDNPSAIKKEELDAWIRAGIIQYHGYAKDTRPYICQADCVVLPSYREGMPRVILEGMAMGRPCITSDAPGCKDAIVDKESGFLSKTADADSLAQSVRAFLALEKTYKIQIGINARKRVESVFSQHAVNMIYVNLLAKL